MNDRWAVSLALALFLSACGDLSPLSTPLADYSFTTRWSNLHNCGPTVSNSVCIDQTLQQQYQEWKQVPYQWGGQSKAGLDCSALVQFTFAEYFNLELPRTTEEQSIEGRKVKRENLRAGDLVFFKTDWRTRHVGVMLNEGEFLHVSESQGVTITPLALDWWSERYWMARRIL